MAITVDTAFSEFNTNIVNLDSERTKKARSSRDWLVGQLNKLPLKLTDFPFLYEDKHIKFGSFARNTKIRPLDDIDLIITFNASGATYSKEYYSNKYFLTVPESAKNLYKLCDGNILNSRKMVNMIVQSLSQIEHYKKADTHRRQEAATLSLTSYEWDFDIVPAFITTDDFYLIPDGNGNWKATDPRVDQSNVTRINQKYDGKILQIIRTLKYWQRRPTMPTIPSYLFEVIILNYFDAKNDVSNYVDCEVKDFLGYLINAIYGSVEDPKGYQGNINTLNSSDKIKISEKAKNDYEKANLSINYEVNDKDMAKAIAKWREIFGNDFPIYG